MTALRSVRGTVRGIGGRAVRRLFGVLDRLNRRHPWSHNDRLHPWIVRRLPESRGAALDIGCGRGDLLRVLAGRFRRVDGFDPDPDMCAAAAERTADLPTVRVRQGTVDDLPATDDGPTGYDAVTMVAVLHHTDTAASLRRIRGLLLPGGRLLVVGLARTRTPTDVAVDLLSSLLNPIVGILQHPRAVPDGQRPPPIPVLDPAEDLATIRAIAERELPGARVRRRLFFRYTLEWTQPSDSPAVTG